MWPLSQIEFILASASPRRETLLQSIGLTFTIRPSQIVESRMAEESPLIFSQRMALEKARSVANKARAENDYRPVLGADTIVCIDEILLGKPQDRPDAKRMIHLLSGRTHTVYTAFSIIAADGTEVKNVVGSEVLFKKLMPLEIDAYLDSGEWMDKAGGYAIQDRAAYFIRAIHGSYTCVVGLPLCEVVEGLELAWRNHSLKK